MAKTKKPILYIFSGLPGSGKTTLSQNIAKQVNAVYLRVDTIEQALRDFCSINVQGEGYCLSYKIASDNLRLGMSVVSDCCNPIELTRREWVQVAVEAKANYFNIEIICSDAKQHRQRVESRISTVPGLKIPNWSEVESHEYHKRTDDRIVIDTANRTETESLDDLLIKLSALQA